MKQLVLLVIVVFIFAVQRTHAESIDREHEIDFSVDLYSKHLWRGFSNGNSVSIQPAIEYSYSGFATGAWAAVSVDGSYYELDLYVAYTLGSFSVTFYDYFCPVKPLADNEFFEIQQRKTKHTFDLNVEYSQPDKHPFALTVATMIYGDDLNPENGKNYFSTYIEPSYNATFYTLNVKAFAGLTPFESYYSQSAAFVNIGAGLARKFPIVKKFDVEAKIKLAYNPSINKGWISFGIGIQ